MWGKCTVQGFKSTDSNIQIPTSGLGQGGKVSLNAIVSSLLSPFASGASLSQSRRGCRTETSAEIRAAKQTHCETIKHRGGARENRAGDTEMDVWAGVREKEGICACQCECEWEEARARQRNHTHGRANRSSWTIERLRSE